MPGVPRRLRHRDEPSRLQDPLQDLERRPAHARRALLRPLGRHGEGAPHARASARVARERPTARGLRRRRLLAPVRAHVHEHPHDARPRADPAPLVGARRGRPAHHRRWPDRHAPRAARDHHRRVRHRRRRGARNGSRDPLDRPQEEGRAAQGAPPRDREAVRHLRAVALRARDRSRHRVRGRRSPRGPRARASGATEHARRSQQVPLPARRSRRRPGGDLRPDVDRDRARLHRGMPLLPGRDDLPPGARARSGAGRRHARQGGEGVGLRRREPHVALDRGLLLHRTADPEGHREARPGEGVARRLLPPRLRPQRGRPRRHAQGPRERRHLRARGRQPAHA